MSARNMLLTSFGFLIVALAAQAAVALLQAGESEALGEAEDRRYVSYRLADELRQSSDDLTRFARTYTVTGDERFKHYFQQVLLIRDGKAPRPQGYDGIYWDLVTSAHQEGPSTGRAVALLDLMKAQGFTAAELDKLEEAKQRSDALVHLEDRAMDAMQGRVPAADGKTIVRGAPDPELARKLVHGPEYHAAKAAIMKPIQEFFAMVDTRTAAEVADRRARLATLGKVSVGIALAAALLALVALVALVRRLLSPVQSVSARLEGMAGEMRATSEEQEVGAAEQSAAVEETRQTFASLLEATRDLSRVGADVLGHAELGQKNAHEIAGRIQELTESTRSIGEILALVKGIANKSEILALNAALEGTKAGEAGRGFSLVASQMQRLAEQVMGSVKKIEGLTGDITKTSQNAVLAAEEAERVATLTTEAAREIAEAVSRQQSGAQQVSTAMDEISQVAHRSVDAARRTVSSAGDLQLLAAGLQKQLHGR